jgi:hypothetical protein
VLEENYEDCINAQPTDLLVLTVIPAFPSVTVVHRQALKRINILWSLYHTELYFIEGLLSLLTCCGGARGSVVG